MRRHWLEQARRVGLPADDVESILAELKAAVEPAIAATASDLPASFPPDVAERVFDGLRAQARRL